MKTALQEWDEQWSERSTPIGQVAPALALALAALVAALL
jgi:hypothetical protein